MITVKKKHLCKNLKENQIVLDIETTGLDSSVDKLVLLGLVEINKGKAYTIQYFAEDDSEEDRLLDIYIKKIKNHELITYNGEIFDIPFLNSRLIKHNRLPILPINFDLLKLIRPYRFYFDFESLKLSDIEKILGFYRDDPSRYKTISKLSEEIKTRKNPYPILKHNENDLIATELLMHLPIYFDEIMSIETKLGKLTLRSTSINNDIANITFSINDYHKEAYFASYTYDLHVDNYKIKINLQVLYGKLDKQTKGFVCLNNFMIKNESSVKVDEHFLIIKEDNIYNYINILALGKKIIENHLWFSICQSISLILFSFKNLLVLEKTLDPKKPL